MSRCFPFPPPGYEKKITTDETNPLIKDKNKEKKHKKDKDKETKEGKEKKSKDRSKDKQKERKEKKEKHKDRKDKEKDKEKSKPLEEKKTEVLTNTVPNNSNGKSKYVQDLARRISYEEEATGSQSAAQINYPGRKDLGITGKAFQDSSFCPVREIHLREGDDEGISAKKNGVVAKSSENAGYRVSFGADQREHEAMGKPIENRELTKQAESPERNHLKENVTKSYKQRDNKVLKKNESKDKDRYKEKKEVKTKSTEQIREKKPELIGWPELEERDPGILDLRNCEPPDLVQASVKNSIPEGILGKRKDHETNGFLYENGTTPNKVQRHSLPVSYSENGRTLGGTMSASAVQGTHCKPEVKEVRVNGFVVSREKQKVCPPNALAATMKVKAKESGEASAKPPHPDLKYLDQILNVPKRMLLLEIDDDNQEWLGGQSAVKLKQTRIYSPDSGESLEVWNQAFRIEIADIVALPYVVPF